MVGKIEKSRKVQHELKQCCNSWSSRYRQSIRADENAWDGVGGRRASLKAAGFDLEPRIKVAINCEKLLDPPACVNYRLNLIPI